MVDSGNNKLPRLKLVDVARRAKILDNCHKIFQEISEQTSHLDAFPDFKFTYENVGNEAETGQSTAFSARQFQYPHSPIEQKNLLNGEAELERKGKKKEGEKDSTLPNSASITKEDTTISSLHFERIICKGTNNAGVT